jgi:beta-N-acetylhexosaminidase
MGGAAVAGSLRERAALALDVGCDLILVCNDRPGLTTVLDGFRPARRMKAERRLRRLYRRAAK